MVSITEESPELGVVPSKLRAPKVRADALVRRPVLDELLARQRRVVVVQAPAGYGKTTTVRLWTDADARPAAWVTLDAGDDDPVVLVRHVLRALAELADCTGTDLASVERAAAGRLPSLGGEVIPLLAAQLDTTASPFVLVLDDVHLVRSAASLHVLERLVDAIPTESTVVICGRSSPSLRLGRHLLAEDAAVVERQDLTLDDDEVRAGLAAAVPDLDDPTAELVVEQLEGWPAGLHLAVLALRRRQDPALSVVGLRGTNRSVAEYFHDELLRHLDEESLEFLLRTSVLERLSGPLCDAVLERSGSGALLERLVASGNMFVVVLDGDARWYRYHHLFAELLLARLRDRSPELEAPLRRRAAAWLAADDDPSAAVAQAIAAQDVELASDLIYAALFTSLNFGRVASVERWLDLVPEPERADHALLALAAGWVDVARGRDRSVPHRLERAAQLERPGPLPDGTRDLHLGREALWMMSGIGGVKRTMAAAETLCAAGPQGSPWWGLANHLGVVCAHLVGDLPDPLRAYRAAEVATRGGGAVHATGMAHIGLLELQAGQVPEGLRDVDEAVRIMHDGRLEDSAFITPVHAIESYAAARRGDAAWSVRAADRALALMAELGDTIPRAQIHLRLILVDAAVERGDEAAAREVLAAATRLLDLEPDAIVLRDWIDRLQHDLDATRRRSEVLQRLQLTPAELRVLAELRTHRSLEEIAGQLYVSRNTVKSHTIAVYRKLGVSGRSEAVERCAELDLLEG
jgi:LuxR family maltose regulon positive regulatory protein